MNRGNGTSRRDVSHHHFSSDARAAELQAMLQDPAMTFAEVGRRLGISRERVRQLAGSLGIEGGRERQRQQREDKAERLLTELISAIPALRAMGFKVEPMKIPSPGDHMGLSSRRFYVNGHLCTTRGVYFVQDVVHHFGPDYVMLGGFRRDCLYNVSVEFVLYHLPVGYSSQGWLVVPAHEAKRVAWIVKLGPPKDTPQARALYRGRWLKYLNAWEVLRGESAGTPAVQEKDRALSLIPS